ncbi:MFS transporter [Tumebacillus permanentifrigoris]|uniref:Fucose permease n=1 Tax=Tumebacillus permanentifrigoris TaxID=378543 RepID=A0A316DBT8_9BACL|nr:MFS transporter [Tumebacillus permanentifrigoris]PWK15661.1 fucose permease [Tumebacillus permanentifrigoris]
MGNVASFLRNRFVQSILLSGLFLQMGIWIRNFAVLLYVMEKTNNDEVAVSLISVAEFAPIFLFSFIGGTFADRWRPKRTMVWCDFLSAISVFVVLLTLVTGTWQVIFFATLVSAILSQFSQPSGMKLFKIHVPAELLQTGMALYQTMFAMFMIIGPALGTFVYQTYGINVSVGIMGVAFLLSAAALMFLPPDPTEERTAKTSVLDEMKAGVKYVLSKPILRSLCGGFMAAGLGVGIIQPLGVFVVLEQLGQPKEFLQWMLMINGAAMIVGGGLAMGITKKMAPQVMLAIGMAVSGITIAVIGYSTNLYLTLAAQFFSGLVMPMIQISINTMLLTSTEEEYIGRANGILNPLFMGTMVLTMSLAGWLKGMTSLSTAYLVSAVCFLIGVLAVAPLFKLIPVQTAKPEEAS